MSTTVFCPQCRESLELPESYLGRSVRCGACQSIFTAAAEPDVPVARPTRNKPIPVSQPGDDGPVNYDPEKRRRRNGVGVGVWLLLGAMTLFGCGCCGVGGWLIFSTINPDFQPYSSEEGRFRAKFPGEVRTTTRPSGRADETAQSAESVRAVIQEQFFVYYVDLSAADQAKPAAEIVKDLAKGLLRTTATQGGKLKSPMPPTAITHQGYEAGEVVIHLATMDQYTQARVIVAEGRGYVIGVTGFGKPDGSPWVEEFLDALEIVPRVVVADKPQREVAPRPRAVAD